ncbi:hypothetical protein NDU88_006930 [Pleurodeles waltl]|uniref:Uncharacterized protein n=1 Tax=Pleurodeles waltl TaxID=8319 RepID=A0AAV7NWJ8_PLEWA|nr:hypothetical protein NDU88_006930 [Pleurodeles waltl]
MPRLYGSGTAEEMNELSVISPWNVCKVATLVKQKQNNPITTYNVVSTMEGWQRIRGWTPYRKGFVGPGAASGELPVPGASAPVSGPIIPEPSISPPLRQP